MNFRKLWHTFAFWGLILSFGVTSCTPSQPAQTQAFQVQANKANAQAQPNPGKGQKKLPKATVYQVGGIPNVPVESDGFSTRALGLPAPTSCYECRWKALNVNASYITADFAPASDSLSLGHPDLSHANSGYHFALNPLETGFDASGNKIVTRLKVYLRVSAYRAAATYKDRLETFSRYLVAGENSFVSTDGINYEFEGPGDYDAIINMSYAKDSAYCETTNTEAMGPASGGYVKLNPDTGEAEVSVQASVPARARVYSGCYSPMKYKYGNNTLNIKVTADINYEDPNPEPTPTPTPVPTATPTPNPTPTPRPSTSPQTCEDAPVISPLETQQLMNGIQSLQQNQSSSFQTQAANSTKKSSVFTLLTESELNQKRQSFDNFLISQPLLQRLTILSIEKPDSLDTYRDQIVSLTARMQYKDTFPEWVEATQASTELIQTYFQLSEDIITGRFSGHSLRADWPTYAKALDAPDDVIRELARLTQDIELAAYLSQHVEQMAVQLEQDRLSLEQKFQTLLAETQINPETVTAAELMALESSANTVFIEADQDISQFEQLLQGSGFQTQAAQDKSKISQALSRIKADITALKNASSDKAQQAYQKLAKSIQTGRDTILKYGPEYLQEYDDLVTPYADKFNFIPGVKWSSEVRHYLVSCAVGEDPAGNPPVFVRNGGSFIRWAANMEKSRTVLSYAQADAFVDLALQYNVYIRYDREGHANMPELPWFNPHFNVGGKGIPDSQGRTKTKHHVLVKPGYVPKRVIPIGEW